MNGNIDKQIADARVACEKANKELDRLIGKKNALPSLETKARTLLRVGHSEAYVQSRLYASRGINISIDDIVELIAEVKKELALVQS